MEPSRNWLSPISVATVCLCLAAVGIAAPAAAQGTPQQQEACTPDVFRLCNAYIPDVASIIACLQRNRRSLSPACRVVMTPRRGSTVASASRRTRRHSQ